MKNINEEELVYYTELFTKFLIAHDAYELYQKALKRNDHIKTIGQGMSMCLWAKQPQFAVVSTINWKRNTALWAKLNEEWTEHVNAHPYVS